MSHILLKCRIVSYVNLLHQVVIPDLFMTLDCIEAQMEALLVKVCTRTVEKS